VTTAPILVVDDDAAIRAMLALALEDEGYPVATARNGRDAFQQILAGQFSLALVDLQMPVMDGITLAQLIRERGIHLPIIFMSAGGRARMATETLHVEGHLEKPFTLEDLFRIVARFVSPHSSSSNSRPEPGCRGTS
jgi:CheY-like chemotaxis protein